MSERNFVQELEYNNAEGVDSTSPLSLMQPGFVRNAQNCNLGTSGGYIKRDGFSTQLTTPWTGGISIRSGIEYRKSSDSSPTTMLFGTTDAGVGGKVGKVVAGAMTDVLTGISGTSRVSFVQFKDHLFMFNGDSTNMPRAYFGGSTTRLLGLDRPASAPSLTENATGSIIAGTYLVAYTYVLIDDATGAVLAESSPSDFGSLTISTGPKGINVPVVASGFTPLTGETVYIRIYRTVANGSVAFLATISSASEQTNASTTYVLQGADTTLLPDQLQLDNTRLQDHDGYSKARFPVVARNRIFIFREKLNEGRFSKIAQSGPLPESYPVQNLFSVEGRHGSQDAVVGAGQIKGVPIVLKQRSIGRLEEVGLLDITQAEDNVAYNYREISESVGAVSHFAQTQVFDELVFLGRDNVYATDGNQVRPIANQIQSTIKSMDFSEAKTKNLSAVNDTKNRRIYISSVDVTTSTQPNFVIVGDYQQYPKFRWTFYTKGDLPSTHPGIRSGSLFQLTNQTDGSLEVHFGNTDANGQFYKLNDGTDDLDYSTHVSRGIFFKVTSRPYHAGQPLLVKLFKDSRIFAEGADSTYALTVLSIADLSGEEEFSEDFTLTGTGNNWDENNWVDDPETEPDPLIWAGSTLSEFDYDPHRKAKFLQLVFKQTEADAPVSLIGWGLQASIFGGQ